MADLNLKTSPFYDNSQDEFDKNYTNLVFLPGMSVQNRELTGIGELANLRINEVASNALGNNTVLTGGNILNVNLNSTPKTVSISETKSIISGYITATPASLVEITGIGQENIYIELIQELISYLEDETLLDPAEGFDNYGNEGAFRKKTYSIFTKEPTGTTYVKIVTLNNGIITWTFNKKATIFDETINDFTDVMKLMRQRTYETSGNYLVSGFNFNNIECLDHNKVGISLTSGIAYVNGDRIETQNKNLYINKYGIVNIVQDEPTNVGYGDGSTIFDKSHGFEFELDKPNAIKINKVIVPSIIKRDITRKPSDQNGSDEVETNLLEIISVTSTDGLTVYNKNNDWVKSGSRISWLPAGNEPAGGSTYSITYSYNRILSSSNYTLLKGHKNDVSYKKIIPTSNTYEFLINNSDTENVLIRNIYSGIVNVTEEESLIVDTDNMCDLGHNYIKYNTVILYDNGIKKIEDIDFIVNYNNGKIFLKFTPTGNITTTYSYFTNKLINNQNYSVVKNKIYFSNTSNSIIPISQIRSSINDYDDKNSIGTINNIKYYNNNGDYILYNSLGSTPDYTVINNRITWNQNLENKPKSNDTYVIELDVHPDYYIEDLSDIHVEYLYENDAEALDAEVSYPSILLVDLDLASGENIIVDYEYYLPRIDYILLSNDGIIENQIGTSITRNFANSVSIPSDKILLLKIFLKPYCNIPKMYKSNNYRLRMSDIRQMYNDLDDLKYNISLSDLEKEAESTSTVTNLRGIFTDNFDDLNKLDFGYAWLLATAESEENYPLNIAIPTLGEGALMMNYNSSHHPLTVNENTTASLLNGKYVMAGEGIGGYTERLWQTQPYATKPKSLAEGLSSCKFVPNINITPDSYMFIEEIEGQNKIIENIIDNSIGINMQKQVDMELIYEDNKTYLTETGPKAGNGKLYNFYETTEEYGLYLQTVTEYYKKINKNSDIFSYINDIETVLNLKQIEITIDGGGFVPLQDYIECYFDNKRVNLTALNDIGTDSDLLNGAVKCNSDGKFKAKFTIPSNCRYGIREVKISCPGGISVSKNFFGSGLKSTSQSVELKTTTIDVETKYTTNLIEKIKTTNGPVFNCRKYCGTTPLCQTLYINNSSLSNFTLSDISFNSDVFLTSANVYFKYCYPDDTTEEVFFAGLIPLNDSGVPISDPENMGPGRWAGDVYYKHNKDIYPLVNVEGADTAEVPYKIDWSNNPIYLMGGKGYGFIVGDINFETKVWVAEVGTSQTFNDVTTGEPISSEPARGILLSSPNGQTWATYITEDLKYDMFIADFSTGSNVEVFDYAGQTAYKTEVLFDEIDATELLDSKKTNFFILNGDYNNSYDGTAFVEFYYSTDSNTDIWIPFNVEQKIDFKEAISTLRIKAVLISRNKYVTPIVSSNFGVTLGRYSNIGYYVSRSSTFNEFNKITYYLDKIYNSESGTTIEAYYSVDDGQIWKQVENPQASKLLFTDTNRIKTDVSKARMYQWNYTGDILMKEPSIIENSICEPDGYVGGTLTDGTYYYRVSLLNHDGSETNPAECDTKNITLANSTIKAIKFNISFDPSASGFRVYRSSDNFASDNVIIYDSTVSSTAAGALNAGSLELNTGDGDKFPNSGRIRVSRTNYDGYAWYEYTSKSGDILSGIGSMVDCANYESDSDFIITTGDIVELFDYDISNLEAINARDGGNGKVPTYSSEVDSSGKYYYQTSYKEDSECIFSFIDDGTKTTNTGLVTSYSADIPVYIKAKKIKFLIKMYNSDESKMDYMYSLPEVRRFLSSCSFNNELLI